MITADRFRELALSFEGTSAAPHFDRTAFKTTRRTFVTLAADGRSANVALTHELQSLFVHSRPTQFSVIPNGWGAQGWTTIDLDAVDESTLKDALRAAHGLAKPAPKPTKKTTATKTPAKKTPATKTTAMKTTSAAKPT